ncbi:hypothetical protein [Micromonospora inyonensis]|uniref:hypothetical protein n=1 Tax=Micromonospora inyonensis TaxID=47866 RepID=UPI000B87098F|nr:hypothetical protein [Micromonospora inyonensis]
MSGQSRTGAKNYTCRTGKHVSRMTQPVDDLVSDVVIGLIERDGADLLIDHDRPDVDALREELEASRVLLKQLGVDYAKKRIPRSTMLAGIEAAEADIAEIEAKLADVGRVDILGPAVAAPDVRAWWYSHDVTNDQRRHIIDTLMDVTILPAVRGRKGFDPGTVKIAPKDSSRRAG